ncbi:DNA-binding protein [Paracoccus sp. WLY502]|uniref:PCC domain-containing protein n=1 Tax=Paracoccus yibinensis TaxID=3068891 RepID=UPI002796493E|nr:PPC domain-containing DNA-binding protein [Paracoccus sp. WLY502]MDQ1901377.1 DNA-binding protein [Paracoccus sp. WLY502]
MKQRMIHPGPRAAERAAAVRAALRPIAGVLPAGQTVMAAVGDLFARHGCKGGLVWLDGVTCDPLRFVLPAPSTDGIHAAWYSATHAPDGPVTIRRATATVGWKDGAPFLHCHGTWAGTMGHLLPFDSVLAEDAPVHGLGAPDAWFEALSDAETAFTLFTPQGNGAGTGLLARIRPGEDVITAIETLAARHGIAKARLHGVGSIDHVRFADGRRLDCHATELRLDGATLAHGRATIPIEVVDIAGTIMRGTLERGANPVGVTLELLIERTKE